MLRARPHLSLLLLLLLLVTCCSQAADLELAWHPGPSMSPTGGYTTPPVDGHMSAIVNHTIFHYGGRSTGETFLALMHAFHVHRDPLQSQEDLAVELHPILVDEAAAPPPITEGSLVSSGHRLWLFGGLRTVFSRSNSLYEFDTHSQTWHPLSAQGAVPSPRSGHCSVALGGDRMLVIGGFDGVHRLADTYVFDRSQSTFTRLHSLEQQSSAPPPMEGHRCARHGSVVYVLGGFLGGGKFESQVWALHLDPQHLEHSQWTTLLRAAAPSATQEDGVPPGRAYGAFMVLSSWEDEEEGSPPLALSIFGGQSTAGQFLSDWWMYDLATGVWSRGRSTAGFPPSSRSSVATSCMPSAQACVLHGGRQGSTGRLSDSKVLVWRTRTQVQAASTSPGVSPQQDVSTPSSQELLSVNMNGGATPLVEPPVNRAEVMGSLLELIDESPKSRTADLFSVQEAFSWNDLAPAFQELVAAENRLQKYRAELRDTAEKVDQVMGKVQESNATLVLLRNKIYAANEVLVTLSEEAQRQRLAVHSTENEISQVEKEEDAIRSQTRSLWDSLNQEVSRRSKIVDKIKDTKAQLEASVVEHKETVLPEIAQWSSRLAPEEQSKKEKGVELQAKARVLKGLLQSKNVLKSRLRKTDARLDALAELRRKVLTTESLSDPLQRYLHSKEDKSEGSTENAELSELSEMLQDLSEVDAEVEGGAESPIAASEMLLDGESFFGDNPTEDLEHLERLRRKTLKEIELLNKQRSKLAARLQEVQEEIDSRRHAVEEAHQEYLVVAKVVEKIRKHLGILKQRDTALQSLVSTFSKRLTDKQDSLGLVDGKIAEIKDSIAVKEAPLVDLHQQLTALKNTLSASSKLLQETTTKRSALDHSLAALYRQARQAVQDAQGHRAIHSQLTKQHSKRFALLEQAYHEFQERRKVLVDALSRHGVVVGDGHGRPPPQP